MARFEIIGGKKLSGKVTIAGNKNSVLPIMAACLLTKESCVLENVPKISDVHVMSKLLQACGAKISGLGTNRLTINAAKINPQEFSSVLTEKLRASVLLMGPILSRLGSIKMGYPGGDIIGRRSLDSHIQALSALGVKIVEENDVFAAKASKLTGAEIFLHEASVTATENTVMAACGAKGKTIIRRAASEPHVADLCHFLVKMGAQISGIGSNVLEIWGVEKLSGSIHSIRPDHIEIGTFAILAAVTGGRIEISPVVKEDLEMILLTLSKFGVNYKLIDNTLTVSDSRLNAV